MDGQRFDDLTRVWATGASRRWILRALVGSAAGALAVGSRLIGAAAQEAGPTTCVSDSDCVDPDTDPCTGASCVDGACSVFIVDCIPGYVCCGNGECCPETAQCQSDADCVPSEQDSCIGVTCENGACVEFIVDCVPGYVCCGNGQCCPANPCQSDADCVSDNPCEVGHCQADGTCTFTHGDPCFTCSDDTGCAGFRDAFGVDGVCCGGLCVGACGEGQVLDASCQCVDGAPSGGTSSTDDGEDGSSGGATTGPIQLPKTGSGASATADRSAWLALVGAGAALIASRLRRAGGLR